MYDFKNGLKKARKKKKYTQKDLAGIMNYDKHTVEGWEQGRSIPPAETIFQLCEILDCDIDYLFNNLDYSKHDVKFICEQTGLSEASVLKLMAFKKHRNFRSREWDYLRVINTVIEQSYEKTNEGAQIFENELLGHLHDYIFGRYERFYSMKKSDEEEYDTEYYKSHPEDIPYVYPDIVNELRVGEIADPPSEGIPVAPEEIVFIKLKEIEAELNKLREKLKPSKGADKHGKSQQNDGD